MVMGDGSDQIKQYFLKHDDEFSSYSPSSLIVVVDVIDLTILLLILMFIYPLEIVENFSKFRKQAIRMTNERKWKNKMKVRKTKLKQQLSCS